jgi:phosphoglycerate dehydrogenase-like enzyme
MKILIVHHHRFELWHAPSWMRDRLQSAFPDHQFLQFESYDHVPQEIADTDVFIGWSLRPEQFVAAKKLRWIHSPAAAVHQLMFPELIASDVIVTNSSNVHGPVVAEHAIAVLLALAKRLPQAMHYQEEKKWAQTLLWNEFPRPREVSGATVVVVGVGGIGSAFIRHARNFGMHVIAVRENVSKGKGEADEVVSLSDFDQVLSRADYIVLCTPVTPATTGMINESRLNRMKPDAYIINVGRGPLIALFCMLCKPAALQGLRWMFLRKSHYPQTRLFGRSATCSLLLTRPRSLNVSGIAIMNLSRTISVACWPVSRCSTVSILAVDTDRP